MIGNLKKYKKKYAILVMLAIAFIILENIHLKKYSQTSFIINNYANKTAQFRFLNNNTSVFIPSFFIYESEQAAYLNFDTLTKEKLLNGYSGYFPKDWYELMIQLNKKLDKGNIEKLTALNVKYIIIDKNLLLNAFKSANDYNYYNKGKVFEDKNRSIVI